MGIIRRLISTGEHIGHATESEARAFFDAKKAGGDVGVVVTPEGQQVSLHHDITDEHVEDAVKDHTNAAGQDYTGTPTEGEAGWKKDGDTWVRDPSTAPAASVPAPDASTADAAAPDDAAQGTTQEQTVA